MEEAVEAFERELILSRLEQHGGNVRAARESLELTKTTFHRTMKRLGITAGGGAAEE
jgi:DNA-binding NtrC family response regulator